MLGLVGFMLGASASVLMLVLLRWLSSLPFGARSLADAIVPWSSAAGGLRIARAAGGVTGWYLGATVTISLAMMAAGTNVVDETTMRVTVSPGGPADRAGVQSGDHVIAVEGEPIKDWDQLRWAVAKRGHEPTRVTIARGGVEQTVNATPIALEDGRGRLMVHPYAEARAVGVGEAIGAGLTEPFKVVWATLKGIVRMFSGTERVVELSGPVQIVSEVSKAPGIASGARLAAALASYVLPFMAIVSVALVFKRRPRTKTAS